MSSGSLSDGPALSSSSSRVPAVPPFAGEDVYSGDFFEEDEDLAVLLERFDSGTKGVTKEA